MAARGKEIFKRECAKCHTHSGEGGKVGPDLTTADRKNRGYMLAQIVDPSGYIRPEYVMNTITTADGRKLSGIVVPGAGETVSLSSVEDLVAGLWPDHVAAAVAVPDARRGERVILATTKPGATRAEAQAWMKKRPGLPGLFLLRRTPMPLAIPASAADPAPRRSF